MNDAKQKLVDAFCRSSYSLNNDCFLGLVKPLGGRLLDLGCNDGGFTLQIARKAKASAIFGLEIDAGALKSSKQKRIKVTKSDLNKPFPFADDYFTTVTANQVIEHLYFTDDFLREVKRVLKPGGQLIISTTNLASLHYRLMLLAGQLPICLHPAQKQYGNFLKGNSNPRHGHKSVFTHAAFIEFIKEHGFKIKSAQSVQLYLFPDFLGRKILGYFPNFGVYSTVRAIK